MPWRQPDPCLRECRNVSWGIPCCGRPIIRRRLAGSIVKYHINASFYVMTVYVCMTATAPRLEIHQVHYGDARGDGEGFPRVLHGRPASIPQWRGASAPVFRSGQEVAGFLDCATACCESRLEKDRADGPVRERRVAFQVLASSYSSSPLCILHYALDHQILDRNLNRFNSCQTPRGPYTTFDYKSPHTGALSCSIRKG